MSGAVRWRAKLGFLRTAARESAAELGGWAPPIAISRLPPLEGRLAGLPSDAALVLRIDQARLPPMEPIGRALRRWHARCVREEIAQVVGRDREAPAIQLAGAQVLVDRPCLLGYELAGRFGNWRVDRTLASFGGSDGGFDVRLEGAFAVEQLRAGLQDEDFVPSDAEESVEVSGLPHDLRLRASRSELRAWNGGAEPGAEELARELLDAGAGGEEALWIHLRRGASWPEKTPFFAPLSGLRCFETFTLRASFAAGFGLDFAGRVRTVDDVASVRAHLDAWRAWVAEGDLGEIRLTVEGRLVEVAWRDESRPALDAIVRALDWLPPRP